MAWQHSAFDFTALSLAAVYVVLFGVCAILHFTKWSRHKNSDDDFGGANVSSAQHARRRQTFFDRCYGFSLSRWTFTIFFELGCVFRALYFFIAPFQRENQAELENAFDFFLNTVSAFFFLTAYSVMLYAWGQLYWRADSLAPSELLIEHTYSYKSARLVRKVTLFANLGMYFVVGTLYTYDFIQSSEVHTVENISTAKTPQEYAIMFASTSLYVFSSVVFFIYGYSIFRAKHREQHGVWRTRAQRLLLRKVFWPAAYIMLAYLIRAVITVLQYSVAIASIWWILALFYIMLEIIPLALMMFVLTTRDKANQQEVAPISQDSHSLYSGYDPLLDGR